MAKKKKHEEHENLEDMMIWKTAYHPRTWMIATYDNKGQPMRAQVKR